MSKRTFAKKKFTKDKKQDKKLSKLFQLVKAETKHITALSSSPLQLGSNTNSIVQTLLTDCKQGVAGDGVLGDTIRLGDSIQVNKLKIRGYCTYNEQSANFLRFILVRVKGLYRTVTGPQLLESYDTTDVRFNNMLSDYNHDYCKVKGESDTNANDVEILWDRVFPFKGALINGTPGYAIYGDTPNKYFKKTIKFKKPLEVTYNVNSQANGHLAMIVLPGCDTTNTSNPNYCFAVNVYFTDK